MAPKLLSESDKSDPTALGDPVSLKAENSDTSPIENDRSSSRRNLDTVAPSPTEGDLSVSNDQDGAKKSLKDVAKQDLNEAAKEKSIHTGRPGELEGRDDGQGSCQG